MHKRFKFYTPLLLTILSALAVYCTGNNKKYHSSNMDNLQNFELIFRVSPNRACTAVTYMLNNNKLSIDMDEDKSVTPGKLDCIQTRVVEKELEKSEKLVQISQIALDDLQVVPHEGCEGGISYSLTLKKEGKEKTIIYYGCAKKFDKNTQMIAHYINSQMAEKYKISL